MHLFCFLICSPSPHFSPLEPSLQVSSQGPVTVVSIGPGRRVQGMVLCNAHLIIDSFIPRLWFNKALFPLILVEWQHFVMEQGQVSKERRKVIVSQGSLLLPVSP